MTHRKKVAHFKRLLRSRGFWRSNAIPPATHILWWFGFEVPPPYFLTFAQGALVAGIYFALMFGILMSALALCAGGHPTTAILVTSVTAGTCFGLFMATLWRIQARRLHLTTWQDYPLPRHDVPANSD